MNGGTPPTDAGFINNLIMGLWALGGAVMRGMTDWKDPVSGKFTLWRAITGLISAFVIGEVALSLALYENWDIRIAGGIACVFGYLGPVGAIAILGRVFGKNDNTSGDKK